MPLVHSTPIAKTGLGFEFQMAAIYPADINIGSNPSGDKRYDSRILKQLALVHLSKNTAQRPEVRKNILVLGDSGIGKTNLCA